MKIYVIILPRYEIIRSSVDSILDIAEEMEISKKEDFFICEERELNDKGSVVLNKKEVSMNYYWHDNRNCKAA
jgi:hypothetical protein